MLFHRVIEPVKIQNWTAVTLDFVIVVVGVVIGIQVANWNQARVEQRELSASLNTGLLRKVPSGELRATLGELLSRTKLTMPFYEMSLRSLTAPDVDPELVKYGLEQSGEPGHEGSLTVVSVDIDRARADPMFRRRIVQAYAIYQTRIRTNDASRRQDCEILAILKAQGYEPNGNWLIENLKRIVPDAPEKDLPDACESEP